MVVYVESNFVLELALLQEQHQSCEELLRLATDGHIRLVVPAFSLTEPYETLIRHARRRQDIAEKLRSELRELGRSAPYEDQAETLSDLTVLLVRSQEEERGRLRDVLEHLVDVAEVVSLTADVVASAFHSQDEYGFSPQDSIVFASILEHLRGASEQSVLLNRNSKDFDDPDVVEALGELGCGMLFRFDDGVSHIRSRLSF